MPSKSCDIKSPKIQLRRNNTKKLNQRNFKRSLFLVLMLYRDVKKKIKTIIIRQAIFCKSTLNDSTEISRTTPEYTCNAMIAVIIKDKIEPHIIAFGVILLNNSRWIL